MKFVALKTEEQQSVLSLHRIRVQLLKMRTMLILGARAVIQHQKEHSPWLKKLLLRRRARAFLGEALLDQTGAPPFAPRCTKDLVEEAVFWRHRTLFTGLELVFFDTTSI